MTGETLALPPSPAPRVGVCEPWWREADAEVSSIARAALGRVSAEAAEIALPHVHLSIPVGAATFTVEGAASQSRALDENAPMSASTRIAFEMARSLSAVSFVQAQRTRALIVRDFERAFESVDLIVTPTTSVTAPPYPDDAHEGGELDEAKINRMVAFTFAQNLTGMPAVSVPCGYDADGMPVGLQIIAPRGEDLRALAFAAAIEAATPRQKPRVWVSPLESHGLGAVPV
jgi:aspartyl-tRNA(Asn)/glutamyl-tRNA(Gln) amidotransferase subunit A